MWKRHPDVLVVGAGPVGLFTALAFAERGQGVVIIDAEPATGAHSYALGLHGATLEALAPYGLVDEVLTRGLRVGTIGLYEGTRREAELRLTDLDGPHPFLLILPQADLEGLLERALRARGVHVRWNHRITDLSQNNDEGRAAYVVEELTKESLGYASAGTGWVVEHERHGAAPLVIGADGYNSKTRRLLGIPTDTIGRGRTFAVFEMRAEGALPDEGRLNFDANGLIVYWPLGADRCRVSIEVEPVQGPSEDERVKERGWAPAEDPFPFLTEEALRGQLRARLPWFRARVLELDWSTAAQFQPRLAGWMGQGNTWLLGDSAHVTGPAGIQSMNAAIVEAAELVSLATPVLAGGGDIAATLKPWGERVRSQWETALGLAGGLLASSATPSWVTHRLPDILTGLPATGRELGALAAQLGLRLH